MAGEIKTLVFSDGVETEAPSGTTPLTDPSANRGELIRRGASDLEAFDAKTDNRVVRGDGTDVVLGQIDDPDFFTEGALATNTKPGLVSNRTDWQDVPSPTFQAGGTNASFTNYRYKIIDGTVFFKGLITFSDAGANTVILVTPPTPLTGITHDTSGAARIRKTSAENTRRLASVGVSNAGYLFFASQPEDSTNTAGTLEGDDFSSGGFISFSGFYELED